MDYETAPMFDTPADELDPVPADPGPTLADVVEAIAAKRDLTNGGQLTLPDEFMPKPAGQLFA